jgi:hypothetical protein
MPLSDWPKLLFLRRRSELPITAVRPRVVRATTIWHHIQAIAFHPKRCRRDMSFPYHGRYGRDDADGQHCSGNGIIESMSMHCCLVGRKIALIGSPPC